MMFEVVKEVTFDAAHYIPNYDGPCGRMHGHRWKVIVYSDILPRLKP